MTLTVLSFVAFSCLLVGGVPSGSPLALTSLIDFAEH